MTEQERYAVSQEERKEKIRARYKGVDRSELEFIPAKQKEKLFEDTGTKRVCAYDFSFSINHRRQRAKGHINFKFFYFFVFSSVFLVSPTHD